MLASLRLIALSMRCFLSHGFSSTTARNRKPPAEALPASVPKGLVMPVRTGVGVGLDGDDGDLTLSRAGLYRVIRGRIRTYFVEFLKAISKIVRRGVSTMNNDLR